MIDGALAQLESAGGAECFVGLSENGEAAVRQSAADVLASVGAWQKHLTEHGVGTGDRVALDLPRGPELLPAHLAVLALGACVVPLNPALSAAERARILARADVRTCVDDAGARPGPGPAPRVVDVAPDAPALLIFTSGTTGEPKGVPHSRRSLEANLTDLAQVWALAPGERLLHALPAHHVHGLVLALYGSARAGTPIVMLPRFDAATVLQALAAHDIAVFMGVPTMYHRMVRATGVPERFPSMRLFISGSAPLSPDDFTAFSQRFGFEPLERYGLTETLIATSNPLSGPRIPGTVGHALPQVDLRLADDGEIELRGPAVMPGYWRDPETTADSFRDGWFQTGDLGELDDDGRVRISGRKKELIIVGGSNVLPGEVEHALAGDPSVDELAVAGLPDPDRGEVVAAFVVTHGSDDPTTIEARLRERAEQGLAAYKRPRVYKFIPELPRNAMGKVNRRALR